MLIALTHPRVFLLKEISTVSNPHEARKTEIITIVMSNEHHGVSTIDNWTVCSTAYSGWQQKHQRSVLLALRGGNPCVSLTKGLWCEKCFHGMTSPFCHVFHNFLKRYHVYVWQVCCDTCQSWMWFNGSETYSCNRSNASDGEINELSLTDPCPGGNGQTRSAPVRSLNPS